MAKLIQKRASVQKQPSSPKPPHRDLVRRIHARNAAASTNVDAVDTIANELFGAGEEHAEQGDGEKQ